MIKFNKLDYKILNHFKYVILALAIMFLSVNTGSAVSTWTSNICVIDGLTTKGVELESGFNVLTFCENHNGTDYQNISVYNLNDRSFGGLYPQTFYYQSNIVNYYVQLYPIGFNVTWDKSEYAKGEKATISMIINATNANFTAYDYVLDVRNPVTYEHTYFYLENTPTKTVYYTFTEYGSYDVAIFVREKSNGNHIYDYNYDDIICSSLLNPVSFLTWQYGEYTEGDEGKLSWGISDSVQYYLLTKNIIIYKDGIQVKTYENLNYFGSLYYKFTEKGYYKADLVLASPITQTIINTDETNVILGDSYLSTNSTLEAGFLNNFSYRWGFTPTYSGSKWLYVKYWNDEKTSWEIENTISLSGTVKDTLYSSSFLVKNEGEYLLELCDLNRKCPAASLKVKSVIVPQKPKYDYTTSSITITSTLTTYAQGDTLKWKSQIKGTDFTDKIATVEIKNNATGINYTLVYVQSDYEEHNYYLGQLYGGGASMLQLVGRNATGAYVLAQTPITMSLTDAGGWGLDISDTKICVDESVKITAISPSNATIRFTDKKITQYNFSGTRTFDIKPNDDMTISLEDNGIQKKYGFIDVNPDCDAVIVDDTGEINSVSDLEYSTTGAGRKLDEFVLIMGMGLNDTSKLIFGVLMIAIALCIMYITTHSVFVAIASGSAIFIWMLAISYIPLWVVILVAITLIMKARQGE